MPVYKELVHGLVMSFMEQKKKRKKKGGQKKSSKKRRTN
jgi:hypothetical protein